MSRDLWWYVSDFELPFVPEPDQVQEIQFGPVTVGASMAAPFMRNSDPSLPSWDALPEQLVEVSGGVWATGSATIHSPLSVSFHDELGDVGSGSVTCMVGDATVTEGNLVHVTVGGVRCVTIVAEKVVTNEIAEGEEADETMTISGRLLPSVLERIVVAPERGLLHQPMTMDRVFDWTAQKFDDSAWQGPSMIVTRDAWMDAWPEYKPPASVVWGVGGTINYAPPGSCYFRWSVSHPQTASPIRWRLWSDNKASWYLDGVHIADTTGPGRDPQMYDAIVDAGPHVLSCVGSNGVGGLRGENQAGASPQVYTVQPGDSLQSIAQALYGDASQWSALFTANATTIESDATADGRWDASRPWDMATAGQILILPGTARGDSPADPRANPAGVSWALTDDGDVDPDPGDPDAREVVVFQDSTDTMPVVLSYPARVPGMTPGEVLGMVLAEWQARGGGGFAAQTFSDETDSAGVAWSAPPDIATKVGTSLLAFLQELAETYIDWRLSPDGAQLDVFAIDTMGKPASGGMGDTIVRTVTESTAQKATWLLASSQIGWSEAGGGAGKARYESTLGLGALRDPGEVARVSSAQAARSGELSTETTVEVSPTSMADAPYVAYRVGDYVGGDQVWSISLSTDEEGRAIWVVSLGSGVDVAARRWQRALDKMSRGTIGGSSRVAQPIVLAPSLPMALPRSCCGGGGGG